MTEVEGGGLAFGAEEDGGVGDAVEAVEEVGHVASGGFVTAAILANAQFGAVFERPGTEGAHQEGSLVADFGADDGFAQFEGAERVVEEAELVGAELDVFRGGGLEGGDEAAVAGHVNDGDFESGEAFEGLGRDLDVAEDDDLADGGDGGALEFLAVLADDEMLAAFADVGAGLLEIEDGAVGDLRENAGDAGSLLGGGGERLGVEAVGAQAIQGFFGLANRSQRAAETAVAEFGGQRRRRRFAVGEFANGLDGGERFFAEGGIERHDDAAFAGNVVDDAGVDGRAELFFEEKTLGADLNGVVVPEVGAAVFVGSWAGAAFVFDGAGDAGSFFDEIELRGDAERCGAELDAARVEDVAVLAGAMVQVGIVDATVLKEAVFDVFVDRQHGFDVFEVVEPGAIGDLIECADGD